MEQKQIENNKIRQVAKDFEKQGYEVVVQPTKDKIPSFIENYQPDLIASNDREVVIIEVKTRADLKSMDKLGDLAELINAKEGYRFELIVTNQKQDLTQQENLYNEFSLSELKDKLVDIEVLTEGKHFNAAFLFCWSYFESLARLVLSNEGKKITNPLSIVKTLFSLGNISDEDYEKLNEFFKIRNQLVHGFKVRQIDRQTVQQFHEIVTRFLQESF